MKNRIILLLLVLSLILISCSKKKAEEVKVKKEVISAAKKEVVTQEISLPERAKKEPTMAELKDEFDKYAKSDVGENIFMYRFPKEVREIMLKEADKVIQECKKEIEKDPTNKSLAHKLTLLKATKKWMEER